MMKSLLPLLLASVASAQSVVVAPGGVQAWVAPVVGAMIGAGPIGAGSVSLDALSRPDLNGTLPFVGSPGLIVPLVSVIQERGITPEVFNSLAPEAKALVLRAAAAEAERRADAVAAPAVEAAAGPVTATTYSKIKAEVDEAAELSVYLGPARRAGLEAARRAVADAQPKLQALFDAYQHDLEAKISAGSFDPENFVERHADGWRAVDESPETRYPTLYALYETRIERLGRRPGPWNLKEASLLAKSLVPVAVASELEKEQPGSSWRYMVRAVDARRDAVHWTENFKRLKMADVLARFQTGTPLWNDFLRVAFVYDSGVRWSESRTERAYKLAAIREGTPSLPSWNDFERFRSEAIDDVAAAMRMGFGHAFLWGLLSALMLQAPPAFALVTGTISLGALIAAFVFRGRRKLLVDDLSRLRVEVALRAR